MIPLLEQYSGQNPPFPKCFYAGKDTDGEIIILEDLKQLDFHMKDRSADMDLEHCIVVMKVSRAAHLFLFTMNSSETLGNNIEICKHSMNSFVTGANENNPCPHGILRLRVDEEGSFLDGVVCSHHTFWIAWNPVNGIFNNYARNTFFVEVRGRGDFGIDFCFIFVSGD